jgi:hypothetical protein
MMNAKDFAIGILSTTAVILLVGVVIMNTRPEPVRADGMTTSTGGDYVLTVGGVSIVDEECLYVLDAPAQKLIAYRFDAGRQQIEIVQGIDLSELRKADDNATAQPSGRRQPTRGRRP